MQDLEKFAMSSLSLMIKFEGQFTIEQDILVATNFKLHVTTSLMFLKKIVKNIHLF